METCLNRRFFPLMGVLIFVVGSAVLLLFTSVASAIETSAWVETEEIVYTLIPTEAVYIPVPPSHHPEHDVANKLVQATTIITGFTAWEAAGGPQGDPNRYRCIVLIVGDAAARFILWQKDHAVLLVWHAVAPTGVDPFVTLYGPKGGGSLLNVPGDIKQAYPDARMEPVNCDQLPPVPPLPAG